MLELLEEYFTASIVYERLHRQASEQLRPYGLTPQQAVVLKVLQGGPMHCHEVADVMCVSSPMITTLTDSLRKSKHLTKKVGKKNKKFKVLELTDKGRAVFSEES